MGRREGGSAAAPHGAARRPKPCGALRRALALLLLATLAAPVSHAALTATSATIRVVAADVGAHSFSASLRATSSARVGKVAWVAWDTAACGSTASVADVQAKRDCNGTVLAGEVNLVRLRAAQSAARTARADAAGRPEHALEPGGGARGAGPPVADQLHAVSHRRRQTHRCVAGRSHCGTQTCD
jgi:hypothetical protein